MKMSSLNSYKILGVRMQTFKAPLVCRINNSISRCSFKELTIYPPWLSCLFPLHLSNISLVEAEIRQHLLEVGYTSYPSPTTQGYVVLLLVLINLQISKFLGLAAQLCFFGNTNTMPGTGKTSGTLCMFIEWASRSFPPHSVLVLVASLLCVLLSCSTYTTCTMVLCLTCTMCTMVLRL